MMRRVTGKLRQFKSLADNHSDSHPTHYCFGNVNAISGLRLRSQQSSDRAFREGMTNEERKRGRKKGREEGAMEGEYLYDFLQATRSYSFRLLGTLRSTRHCCGVQVFLVYSRYSTSFPNAFLLHMWNLKTIGKLINRRCCSFSLFFSSFALLLFLQRKRFTPWRNY